VSGADPTRELAIASPRGGTLSALLLQPRDAWALYVLAHGAGAGMRHAFLEDVAARFALAGVGTLRFQFPYTEAGGHRPDPPATLEATVRAAVTAAAGAAPGLPLFAGGKSMGGRMTSQAQAGGPLPGVRGLVFLGFPLHAPKRPAVSRARHLADVSLPMLFVQGTRDDLADLQLMRGVCAGLGARSVLHVVEGGDHSFKMLKRSGRDQEAVMNEIRDAVTAFMRTVLASR
jgi:predicted alpha/beta-hydrolase family hydrolase